ncbi:MAG: hypothetical protein IJ769_08050 [Clostridia bacterium]|nr:hypothetical protein [Clostridia bacterium]
MKKTMVATLAVALLLTLLCGTALAYNGDLTATDAKAYSNASMTEYVGTIPAGTSVLVRSYDGYADVYVNGKVVYIDASDLLHTDIPSDYVATLVKGTKVYQRPASSAKSAKLKKDGSVKVCAVSGDWALVQTTGSKGIYGFVKVSKLTDIRTK